ncbi:MAG TPA: hypothetical protein VN256_21600 [Pyrinomonadaceae bacterium]|nr:hypothetical protein [Pyrinomonadaceae bacterium]
MSTIRCLSCGFLNFAADSVCKRCREALAPPSDNPYFNSYVAGMQGGYQTAPGYAQPAYSSGYFPGAVAPLPRVSKNGGANVALLVLVGLVVAVAGGIGVLWKIGNGRSANFAWQEYKSKDEIYSVTMPKKPVHVVQNYPSMFGEVKVPMMMADMQDRGAFLVGHSDYTTEDIADMSGEQLLDIASQNIASEPGTKVLGKKSISLDGHPGMELELKMDQIKGKSRTVARFYWVAPQRIYIMFASVPTSSDADAQLSRFLDSLKIRKP